MQYIKQIITFSCLLLVNICIAQENNSNQINLEILPSPGVYTSTTIGPVPFSWFDDNIQKANKIIEEYISSKSSWTHRDAFVSAFRLDNTCDAFKSYKTIYKIYTDKNIKLIFPRKSGHIEELVV